MRREAKGTCKSVKDLLSALAGLFAGLALFSWIFMFLLNSDNPLLGGTSVALAPAVAIVGVFGWTGGMSSKFSPMQRAELRKIGILHTATAVSLVVMGMLIPSLEDKYSEMAHYQVVAWVYVALVFLSSATFGTGTGKFASILLDLWKTNEEPSDEEDGMSTRRRRLVYRGFTLTLTLSPRERRSRGVSSFRSRRTR